MNSGYLINFECMNHEIFPISAISGSGTGELMDRIVEMLPQKDDAETTAKKVESDLQAKEKICDDSFNSIDKYSYFQQANYAQLCTEI